MTIIYAHSQYMYTSSNLVYLKQELEMEAEVDPIRCIARKSGQGFRDQVSVLFPGQNRSHMFHTKTQHRRLRLSIEIQ